MEQKITSRDFCLTDIPEITKLTNELGYPTTEEEMTVRMKVIANNPNYKTVIAEYRSPNRNKLPNLQHLYQGTTLSAVVFVCLVLCTGVFFIA